MGGGIAHAADAGNPGHARQQGGEIPAGGRGVAIAVDVLTQQLDLGVAALRQAARFVHHALAGAAALRPAREGHHAIGARLIASLDDGDVGPVGVVAAGERRVEGFVRIEAQAGDPAVSRFELHQHLAEARVTGRAGHQAHVRGALEDLLAFLLGHASQHGEELPLARLAFELLQPAEDFLLGFVPNAARIVEHQPGILGPRDLRITPREKRADHLFGIVRVHLAAEGFNVEGFPRHRASILVQWSSGKLAGNRTSRRSFPGFGLL